MTDNVNHPQHYEDGWSNGAEVIDITENLNFNRGNAVKYIARAGKKDPTKELEDLEKAQWCLAREIYRLGGAGPVDPILEAKMADEVVDLDEPTTINVNSVEEALAARRRLKAPRTFKLLNDECIPEDVRVVRDVRDLMWYKHSSGEFWTCENGERSDNSLWLGWFTEVVS